MPLCDVLANADLSVRLIRLKIYSTDTPQKTLVTLVFPPNIRALIAETISLPLTGGQGKMKDEKREKKKVQQQLSTKRERREKKILKTIKASSFPSQEGELIL